MAAAAIQEFIRSHGESAFLSNPLPILWLIDCRLILKGYVSLKLFGLLHPSIEAKTRDDREELNSHQEAVVLSSRRPKQ